MLIPDAQEELMKQCMKHALSLPRDVLCKHFPLRPFYYLRTQYVSTFIRRKPGLKPCRMKRIARRMERKRLAKTNSKTQSRPRSPTPRRIRSANQGARSQTKVCGISKSGKCQSMVAFSCRLTLSQTFLTWSRKLTPMRLWLRKLRSLHHLTRP